MSVVFYVAFMPTRAFGRVHSIFICLLMLGVSFTFRFRFFNYYIYERRLVSCSFRVHR